MLLSAVPQGRVHLQISWDTPHLPELEGSFEACDGGFQWALLGGDDDTLRHRQECNPCVQGTGMIPENGNAGETGPLMPVTKWVLASVPARLPRSSAQCSIR